MLRKALRFVASARFAAALLPGLLVSPATLAAQGAELRGVVRDSATGTPVPGAVVMVLDARGAVVNRTIAGARGQYRVLRPAGSTEVRTLRLGFRPAAVTLGPQRELSTVLDLVLAGVPRTLEAMDVVAARGCPVRSDRAEAFGLLDQARAGLLATVVAREQLPAAMRVLRYERRLDLDGVAVERQSVQIDSSVHANTSFNAVQSAPDFVNGGFRTGSAGRYTYFGPDADVLLDTRFQGGYCFSEAAADSTRPGQRGLRFAPASRRRGRIDIDGTLWIDTAQRKLRDIEFVYVGIEPLAAAFGAGGHVGFHTTPSGLAFIDRWSLRLVGPPDTIVGDAGTSVQEYAIREIGGEVAESQFSDSSTFRSSLSAAMITAVRRDGTPARFTRLQFAGTDYTTRTDSAGRASIPFVLPGPYRIVARDPALDLIDLDIPTGRAVTVARGSATLLRVTVPTAEQYVASLCGADTLLANSAWLLARVVGSGGESIGAAGYRISDRSTGRWRVVAERGLTPSSGLVPFCRTLERNAEVEFAAWRRADDPVRVRQTLEKKLTVVRLTLPTGTSIASAPMDAGTPPLIVTGIVTDSVRGLPVADARVTFLGTPLEGATDSTGRFLIGGVTPGVHRIEVSTPWHDSIGAVARRTVVIRDTVPLTLHVPPMREILQASCGNDGPTGAIVGRVTMHGGAPVPDGLRVVANWRAREDIAQSAESVVESGGTYRLCGVPLGAAVDLQTTSQGAVAMHGASAAQRLIVTDLRPVIRADLEVDSSVVALPVFVGSVVSDSAGLPIRDAEVALTDIGLRVRTDERGAFRLVDVPVGTHLVTVKQVGFAQHVATLDFPANRTVEHLVQLSRAASLKAMTVTADGVPAGFEERRSRGNGRFLTRADLARQPGRRLGEVLSQVSGFGQVTGGGSHSYVIGKRPPTRLPPQQKGSCSEGEVKYPYMSCFAAEALRAQGFYCPTDAERRSGVQSCACFAQVYVDDQLMNSQRPTEPFDVSTVAVDEVAGVEFYASAATTPARYASLGAVCGVMVIWTRR